VSGLPTLYTVEAQFDGTNWIDISDQVAWTRGGININRGRADEQSEVQPSQLTVALNNTDGRFTPGNTASPYYPDVTDAVRIRVRYDGDDRFNGWTGDLPMQWADASATHAVATWTASDITERVADRSGTLRSFVVEEALYDDPLTYLPLDEPTDAAQAGNLGSVTGAATLLQLGGTGTAEFGAGTGPAYDGSSSLVLTPTSTTVGYYLRAPTLLSASAMTVEAFVNSTTASGTIVNVAVPAGGDPFLGYGMALTIDSGKNLAWRSDTSLTVTSPSDIADGETHHVAAVYEHTGTLHRATLYVDGTQVASGSVASTWVNVFAYYVLVGGGQKMLLLNGTINHVGVYSGALSADRILAHAQAGLTGFGGERSDQRVSRIAAYAGLESLTSASLTGVWVLDSATLSVLNTSTVLAESDLTLEVGSATVYGQSRGGSNYLAAMQDVARTEGGVLFVGRDGLIQFHGRDHRYNTNPVIVLDADEIAPDLTPTFDNQGTANDVTATTEDGSEARYVDTASVTKRGTYDGALSLLTRDVTDAYSAAAWRVNRYGAPQVRYKRVTVQLHGLASARVSRLLDLEVGDRLDLTGLPSQAPDDSTSLFIEGYTEQADAGGWTLTFNTSSADGYQVWSLDSPVRSQLDSTTILAY
jgi:hypothetical protein